MLPSLFINGPTLIGRELDPDTHILMSDGSTKSAGNINVDDQVMGKNGQPISVISCVSGLNDMYEIIPKRGEKYKVTGDHILLLKSSHSGYISYKKSRNRYSAQWLQDFVLKSKNFPCSKYNSQEEAYQSADYYLKTVVPTFKWIHEIWRYC